MRNLVLSVIALAAVAGSGAITPVQAQPTVVVIGSGVQTVQYYEPGWREREEWRRRREIEFRRREEWRREEWRAAHGYPPPPPGYPPPPPPYYAPRY